LKFRNNNNNNNCVIRLPLFFNRWTTGKESQQWMRADPLDKKHNSPKTMFKYRNISVIEYITKGCENPANKNQVCHVERTEEAKLHDGTSITDIHSDWICYGGLNPDCPVKCYHTIPEKKVVKTRNEYTFCKTHKQNFVTSRRLDESLFCNYSGHERIIYRTPRKAGRCIGCLKDVTDYKQ